MHLVVVRREILSKQQLKMFHFKGEGNFGEIFGLLRLLSKHSYMLLKSVNCLRNEFGDHLSRVKILA